MTNHIEELMKAAGVESKKVEIRCQECDARMEECGCFDCFKEVYPDFTPTKQLELIKLIIQADNIDNIHQYYYEISNMFIFECRSLPELGACNQWSTQNANYELALAELVLILITENQLDKSEVKKILED